MITRSCSFRRPGASFSAALGFFVLFGLCGCHTRPASSYRTLGWEKHRLPNAAKPYHKLLVEIDAVAGSEPTADELTDIRTYLEQLTSKPGGVTVKLDNVIPRATAHGRAPTSLALEYLNGPPDEGSAFIYILCYRGRISPLPGRAENPHFTYYPYPSAVFINRAYAFGWFSLSARARQLMMRHELGHALGLADNASHTKEGHCTNKGCLMRPGIRFDFFRFLTFRPGFVNPDLCADCHRDLEGYRLADAPPGARFWRGYFVRSGERYHIFTLPGMVYVHLGEMADVDAARLAALRRAAMSAVTDRGDRSYEMHGDMPEAAEGLRRLVENESEVEGLMALAEKMLAWCLAQAETLRTTDQVAARELVALALPAAALKFPALHAKLQALYDSLAENEGAETRRG